MKCHHHLGRPIRWQEKRSERSFVTTSVGNWGEGGATDKKPGSTEGCGTRHSKGAGPRRAGCRAPGLHARGRGWFDSQERASQGRREEKTKPAKEMGQKLSTAIWERKKKKIQLSNAVNIGLRGGFRLCYIELFSFYIPSFISWFTLFNFYGDTNFFNFYAIELLSVILP